MGSQEVQSTIRVLVADDHEFVRRGVCAVLSAEPSINLCGEAVDGHDAVEKAKQLRPDVVLMDISMPNLNGLEATREIKRILPQTKVLVLSQHDSPEMVRQAFQAGARGYVAKSAVSTDLLLAIAKLHPRPPRPDSTQQPTTSSAQSPAEDSPEHQLQRLLAVQSALRESEERFRSAMSSMADGLYTIDTNGLVTYVNVPAERMFGWNAGELFGKHMHDLTHYKRPDGSAYPAEECPGLQVLKTGLPMREHEDVFIRKDGTFFPVVFSASPMEIEGNIVGLVVSFRDDTKRREAERALRESERVFRAIGDSIDFGVWICDPHGKTLYVSPSFLQLLGISLQECTEHGWIDKLHPDERDATISAWQQCLREGTFWERESRFLGTDGEYHYVLTRGVPIRDSDGKITNWAGLNLDIQNRKKSELALQRTSTQFQVVTDTMAVAVTRCSRDLRFLWVNPRYAAWVGRPPEEILERPIAEVLGQERFDHIRGYIDRVLEGKPVTYQEQVSFKGLRERWISVNYVPTFSADGVADGWVSSLVDITDRKQQEAAITKQSRLLDFSFNAVILWDEQHRITYWNRGAEELYGWTNAEALGQAPYDLLKTEFPQPIEDIFAQLKSGEPWQGELVHTHKNGHRLTVLSRWAMARDPETNTHSISEINIDISKTKEAELQLHQLVQTLEARVFQRTQQLESASDKLRELSGRLLRTQDEERRRIARELHDGVGQLLAALKMNLSKLTREKHNLSPEANQSLEENISLIQQASQEIRTMSHLLHPPLLDEVGLESALRWYVDGFSERSKINVRVEMAPGFAETLPRELALALFRIVQECLTNVHRHSGSETAVVTIERRNQEIRVEVSDDGKGIPQDVRDNIVSGQSSGVGLRGMRERIRQFGGRLEVLSRGNGTSIISVLPAPERELQEMNAGETRTPDA